MMSSRKNEKKNWKIKKKIDTMWWGEWKWCRQEKNKKIEKYKWIEYNVMEALEMVSSREK